jgi:uncharacterized protein
MPDAVARAAAVVGLLLLLGAGGGEPSLPAQQGFVTDAAGVIGPGVEGRLTRLLEELREKTGAEIAVVTVETTAPLDDFTYAMRIADAWKPGRKGEDTGVVFLVATRDRRVRVLVGYGLEGILPDGLVGEIQDREVVPEFRAGRMDEGIWRGVGALATRIAASRGVQLTGAPTPRAPRPSAAAPPLWLIVVVVLVVFFLMRYQARSRTSRVARGGFSPWGGWGGFGGSGGFGGGGGGWGGFGGGSFGGGGAGRSW